MTRFALPVPLAFVLVTSIGHAEDWPQWMGPKRDDVWNETGIVEKLPKADPKTGKLKPLWTTPISGGFSGPAVADGKVYVFEREPAHGAKDPDDPFDRKKVPSTERVLCLDAKNGKQLWKHDYECPYQISYPCGPRCTPTVHDGKVYTLGAMGHLRCLNANTGKVIWSKHFPSDYKATVPMWGFCGHPLVYKNLLICIAGGEDATVVAFDKDTGAEKWKSLNARDPGYGAPTLIHAGGVDQVVIWTGQSLNGLDPQTGNKHWSVELEPMYAMSIMSPRQVGDRLFAAGIGGAGVVLKLDNEKPKVSVVWQEAADAKTTGASKDRGVYPVNMTPFVDRGTIYGVDQPGMLRAVDLESGKRHWFTHQPVLGREEAEDYKGAVSGTAFVVKNGERYFFFAETGDLVIAKLSPKEYVEVSRAKLIEPTGGAFGRKVVWSHPAFANKCIYVRNDKEIACFSLAAE